MDTGSKRRLPSWMGRSDAAKLNKSVNMDERPSSSIIQCESQDCGSMAESLSSDVDKLLGKRRMFSEKFKTILDNSSLESSGKIQRNSGSNNSKRKCDTTKKKDKQKSIGCEQSVTMSSLSSEQTKLKRAKGNNVKILSQEMIKDEVELTIEDLISLAEECLRANKETQPEPPVASISNPMVSSVSSTARGRNLNGAFGSLQVLTKCAQSSSCEKQVDEAATSAAQKKTHAGDPAQDMLELFLGPLLQKAPPKESEQEKTIELPRRNFVDVCEGPSLIEKKSSLKDKVALFFN